MQPKLLLSLPKGAGQNYINAFSYFGFEICADYLANNTSCDGLVLCGGGDIAPEYFGQKACSSNPPDKERDVCEFFLFEQYYGKGKPIFGICRGMQVINVALGGSLIQHLESDVHFSQGGDLYHTVKNKGEAPVWKLFGDEMTVNSAHHQACSRIGRGLVITQTAVDGIAEGLLGNKLIGTQWHPERMVLSYASKDFTDPSPLFDFFKKMF